MKREVNVSRATEQTLHFF